MSINKLISYKNVLVDLLDNLNLDHTKYTPMFTRWIEKAETKIGSRYQYTKKKAVLDIKGCHADLPSDAQALQLAIIGDQGCDCTDLFNQCFNNFSAQTSTDTIRGFNNLSFLVVDVRNNDSGPWDFVEYEVQDNKLIFKQNLDGLQVTVQYLGLATDCDGILQIGENHVDAITEYCMWQYRRQNIKSGIDLGLARDHQMNWERQCLNARAIDAGKSFTESERRLTLELLHDPHAGWGLPLTPTMGTWIDTGWS